MEKSKFYLPFLFLLATNYLYSQSKVIVPKSGSIIYLKQSKITDSNSFKASSVRFVEHFCDNLKLKVTAENDNTGEVLDSAKLNQATEAVKYLLLNEMFETTSIIKSKDEFDTKRILHSEIDDTNRVNERFYFNITENMVYNSHDSVKIPDYFEHEEIISLKEYKAEKKNINGYSCFKLIYKYRDKFDNDEIGLPIINYKRILWVTDKIISPFHSIVRSKAILSKYYPLEITESLDEISGFETNYTLEAVNIK